MLEGGDTVCISHLHSSASQPGGVIRSVQYYFTKSKFKGRRMESSMFGYTGFTLCLVLSHLLDQMGSSLLTTFFFLQMTSTCSVHWSSLSPMYGLFSLKLLVLGDCLSFGKTGALASGPAAS